MLFSYTLIFNALQSDTILDLSKFKAFANRETVNDELKLVFGRAESSGNLYVTNVC